MLDVHLQVKVSAGGSSTLGAVQAGETDHGQDLMAALLSGALRCLTDPGSPNTSAETAGPISSPPGTGIFRREGEYWTIAHGGTSFLLKDMKGLRHLARLLAHPDREFHALDLVRLGEGANRALPDHGLECGGILKRRQAGSGTPVSCSTARRNAPTGNA
ncbi:MAG: hypothetical protein ACRDZ4_20375 [Egibacteraceae bacterium]